MKNTRAARRYAVALMNVSVEQRAVDRVADDLQTIGATLAASRELRVMLTSPVISPIKKKAVFDALFAKRVGKEILTFAHLLIHKNREALLPDLIEEFRALLDDQRGLVNVDAATATPMTPAQEGRLQKELERYTGKKVQLRLATDPSVRGGLIVKIGDTVLDGSIRRQLVRLREQLLGLNAVSN
jgi:F-type H+-transporting ATPase subunit delta